MSREDPQMKIRLPADLKNSVEAAAKARGRTMNAEVVARLQASFQSTVDLEDSAIAGEEVFLTPALSKLVHEAATAAAERVVLKVQGFAPLEFGTPRVQQGPPPEPPSTPKKPAK